MIKEMGGGDVGGVEQKSGKTIWMCHNYGWKTEKEAKIW